MSAARDLLDRAAQAGMELLADGDRLRWRAPQKPPADLLAELSAHKPELLAALSAHDPVADLAHENENDLAHENDDERAALIEFGSGCPGGWAEGFARLVVAPLARDRRAARSARGPTAASSPCSPLAGTGRLSASRKKYRHI